MGEEAEYHFLEVHLGQLEMKPVKDVDKELFESVLAIFCQFLLGLAGELVRSEAVDQFVDGELNDVRVVRKLLIELEEAKDELVGVALILLVLSDLPGLLRVVLSDRVGDSCDGFICLGYFVARAVRVDLEKLAIELGLGRR